VQRLPAGVPSTVPAARCFSPLPAPAPSPDHQADVPRYVQPHEGQRALPGGMVPAQPRQSAGSCLSSASKGLASDGG
jgi:hypothetical protein